MVWVPIDQRMRDGAEMSRLRRATGLATPALLGHLTLLWLWAIENAPTGILAPEPFVIADAIQWQGDPDEMADALISSGFLLAHRCNGVEEWEIFEFADRMAAYLHKLEDIRSKGAARVRKWRAEQAARAERGQDASNADSNVTVTSPEMLHVTPVTRGNWHNTEDQITADHRTGQESALSDSARAAIQPEQGSAQGPQWINEQAKFEAFREYEPDDSDWAWCRKNAPVVTPESWEGDRENYQEWCDINRRKLTKDYDSPPSFWRRWQRGVMERASKAKGANHGSGRYADRRLQVGQVGATGGQPESSRERARGARRVANE